MLGNKMPPLLGLKSLKSLAKALHESERSLVDLANTCQLEYPYRSWREPKKSGRGSRLIETPIVASLKQCQVRINSVLQRLSLPVIFHGCYSGTDIKTN